MTSDIRLHFADTDSACAKSILRKKNRALFVRSMEGHLPRTRNRRSILGWWAYSKPNQSSDMLADSYDWIHADFRLLEAFGSPSYLSVKAWFVAQLKLSCSSLSKDCLDSSNTANKCC